LSSDTTTAGFDVGGAFDVNAPQAVVAVVAALGLLTLPFWASESFTNVMVYAGFWAVFAAGWDVISGHTGYISFGHSLLSGSAAYATALLVVKVDPHLSLFVTIPVSIGAAVAMGMVFGLPSLRLRGPYFSLVTFTSVLIALKLIDVFSGVTNGHLGMSGIDVFTYDTTTFYYYTLGLAACVGAVLVVVSRSNVGRVLLAINAREQTVEEAGIDTTKFKLWAFLISAITMGFGGVFLAHYYGNVSPANSMSVADSILIIAMAAVGGTGSIVGPMAGAYLLLFLRDVLFQNWLGIGSNVRLVLLWAIVVVLLVAAPEGVFVRLWRWLGDPRGGGSRG